MAGEFITQSDEHFRLPTGAEYIVPARPGEPEHTYQGEEGELVNGSTYFNVLVYPKLVAGVAELMPAVIGLGLSIAITLAFMRGVKRAISEPQALGQRDDTKSDRERPTDRRQAERAGQGGLQRRELLDWRTKLEKKRERKRRNGS